MTSKVGYLHNKSNVQFNVFSIKMSNVFANFDGTYLATVCIEETGGDESC